VPRLHQPREVAGKPQPFARRLAAVSRAGACQAGSWASAEYTPRLARYVAWILIRFAYATSTWRRYSRSIGNWRVTAPLSKQGAHQGVQRKNGERPVYLCEAKRPGMFLQPVPRTKIRSWRASSQPDMHDSTSPPMTGGRRRCSEEQVTRWPAPAQTGRAILRLVQPACRKPTNALANQPARRLMTPVRTP